MDVRTRKALQGYISRQPRLKRLPDGVALFIAQLGQKHYRREDDGAFTLVGTSYVKIVMLGEHAETASDLFAEGDDVIALGEFRTRTYEHRGQRIEETQFQTAKLLFDTTRSRYTVARTPRAALDLAKPAASAEFRAPQQDRTTVTGR